MDGMTAIEEFVNTIKEPQEDVTTTYSGVVSRVDSEGTVWVYMAGSDKETPTASASSEIKRGDFVNLEWRNNKLYIVGNTTNPSAGVTRVGAVEQAAQVANTLAEQASSDASRAKEAADSAEVSAGEAKTSAQQAITDAATAGRAASMAQSAAEAAQATADIKKRVFTAQPVPPYNVGDLWVDLGSADFDLVTSAGDVLVDDQANALIAAVLGTGSETVVYVSTFARTAEEAYTESDWTLAATDDAKVDELREWFWHDSLGAHVLGDATGFRNDITSTGMQIIDTSTETSVATFGASGVQIGRNGEMHFEQTSTEMQFIDAQDIIRSKITADSTNGICIEDATYQFYIKSSSSGIELVDDQNNGLKVDSGGVYINSVKVEDFVTDEGTSGSWRYRKWNSGKIEAWFEGTFSCAASTTARGALYYSNWSLTIPSAIGFTAAPNTLIGNTGDSETVISVNGSATSATAMSGNVWRYASSSSALSITARIYAWQN